MSVLLLHAYSRTNRGDGLLVDLAVRRLERLGVPRDEISVVALDADSFTDVHAVPHPLVRPSLGRARSLLASARRAAAILAVGGGYLRSDGWASAARFTGAHMTQLAIAARNGPRALYLPQSIGPLPPPTAVVARRLLARVRHVCVRDDVSLAAFRGLPNIIRLPDMAVLEVAERGIPVVRLNDPPVVMVVRAIPNGSRAEERLRALRAAIGDVQFAIQSDGRGNDDREFTAAVAGGVSEQRQLGDVLRDAPGSVVIAVRLHAALSAILNGSPTVHLSYERKGWGAFNDLGLNEFVHDVRSFDVATVTAQVEELRSDPTYYWSQVRRNRDTLLAASTHLDGLIRGMLR